MRAIYAQNTKVWFWVWIQVEPDLKSKFLNGPLRSPRPATTNFHWSSQCFCPPPTDADVIPINIWLEFLRKTKEEDKRERSAEGVLKRERERFVAVQVREKSLTLTVNRRFLLKLTCFFFFFKFYFIKLLSWQQQLPHYMHRFRVRDNEHIIMHRLQAIPSQHPHMHFLNTRWTFCGSWLVLAYAQANCELFTGLANN